MDLPLCVLLSVILLCFILLVVVSGIRFRFSVTREPFQDVQQAPEQLSTRHPTEQVQGPTQHLNGGAVELVRSIEDTPPEDRKVLFHNTQCRPECCANGRGSYSCSTGCVCVTDDQLDLISRRGGNHSAPCL